MARNDANATDGSLSDQSQYIKTVDEITVDADQVVKHLRKNIELKNSLYDPRSFKLSVSDDGTATASAGVDPRDDGAYYDGSPHPIWLSPRTFVEGFGRGEDRRKPHFPTESESRSLFKDEHDVPEDHSEWHEETQEQFDEWHQTAMEAWESEVRSRLKDEMEFSFDRVDKMNNPVGTETHTAAVRYE